MARKLRRDTEVLDALRTGKRGGPLGLPIEQSATWSLRSAEEGARFSQEVAPPAFYTRWGNPTTRKLEDAIARLEGGEAGLATGSGMGAISTVLLHYARKKKHIVAQRSLYSATTEMLTRVLPDFGARTDFIPGPDTDQFASKISRDTALVYLETPSNPLLEVADIQAIAEHAEGKGVPVAVDNTFASPLNQRPLALGATITLHSATKYLGGHSDATGGVLAGDRDTVRDLWIMYKMLGPTLAPHEAFLIHRGMKTLALRVARQNANAMRIAEFLARHPAVERVYYPGLKAHPGHDVAARQMTGFGGMLSFEVKGGYQPAKRTLEATEVCVLGVSLGGVETLIEQPALMSYFDLDEAALEAIGVDPALIRLSVGIEDADDVLRDLLSALEPELTASRG
ncbi:MAG: trans-sulfuration enzyme family protein, partial [Myxococcota bacterium]